MTEFTPLAESASSAVLLYLIGLPTAFRTPGFRRELWIQAKAVLLFVVYVAARIVGAALGTGAWMGSKFAWMVYILADLWSPKVADKPWEAWQSLHNYCSKRQFYQAQHAA